MNNYTDTQLKQALAKLAPDLIDIEVKQQMIKGGQEFYGLVWKHRHSYPPVLDTELLHLCWLVGKDVEAKRYSDYLMHAIQDEICTGAVEARYATANATWQQRVIALAKVKGIEIV